MDMENIIQNKVIVIIKVHIQMVRDMDVVRLQVIIRYCRGIGNWVNLNIETLSDVTLEFIYFIFYKIYIILSNFIK